MHRRLGRLAPVIAVALIVLGCSAASDPNGSPVPTSRTAPSAIGSPAASADPTGTGMPAASSATGASNEAFDELPTRIVVPSLRIDLPIVSGDLSVAGNPTDYPLCDVAQYLTTYPYPGRPGTSTWIYGHARDGMLLPLLKASESHDGRGLIGSKVRLYTDGAHRYTYRITKVIRHATDRTSAARVPAGAGRLVLQTSEGPRGTVPKLQVIAELLGVDASTAAESQPKARPRGCSGP